MILLVKAPLLGADLEAALLALGVQVQVREPSELGLDVLRAAVEAGAEGLVSINHSPELALLASVAGLRYVSWTIDPLPYRRWTVLGGTDAANCTVLVHRKALVAPLIAMAPWRVEWMPLACAVRRMTDSAPSSHRTRPALFVGSSLEDERRILTQGFGRWGMAHAVGAVDDMLLGLAKASLWDRSFPGFLRSPQTVPASLKALLPKVDPMDLAEVLDAGLAWHFRRELVRILAGAGAEVKGDAGWREVAGERWTGPLRNGQEMTEAYARAAVNLDVPRLHQREIATLRAFDAMGSGGLFACETGTELDELLRPGEHFLTWSDPRGLFEILEAAKHADPKLDGIAQSGCGFVRREHSLEHRARRILSCLTESDKRPASA